MKRVQTLLLVLGCLMLMAAPAQARQAMGIHAKTVDGFVFLPDNSGSMLMTHKATGVKKLEMAKQIMIRLNAKNAHVPYQAALVLFSPNKTVVAPAAWDRAGMGKAINAIPVGDGIYGRMTPMGDSFDGLRGVLSQLPGKNAAVLISDGYNNLGQEPVTALRNLYAANPGLVVHFVSVADHPKGAASLKALAAVNPASLLVDGRDIINTEEAAIDFVTKAFYNETIPNPEVQSLREVFFQSGKYVITKPYATRLDALARVMVTRPELKIFVEGFADVTGNKKKNQTLSENRANAVKNYLVSKGCKGEQIIAKGRGQTGEYPSLLTNRRVEIMIINQ